MLRGQLARKLARFGLYERGGARSTESVITSFFTGRVPVHVVQKRLGHKRVETTMNVYANVLPSMQQDAAERLAALLYG
jgi:integrase